MTAGDGEAPSGAPPSAAVTAAFDLQGRAESLPGGQGRSWLVGQVVLKPLDMPLAALQWQADLLTRLDRRDDLRVSVPLRTRVGSGAATAGRPGVTSPESTCPVAGTTSSRPAGGCTPPCRTSPSPLLATRTDIWSLADRVAWAELPAQDHAGTKHLDRLLETLTPVPGVPQLVHGDLTGNVLFHPHLPPLVIDLSPYWRPPAFASATVIADALVFEGAGPDVVQPLLVDPTFPQYLLRALIYRTVTDHLARPHVRRPDVDDPYRSAVDLAVDLAQTSR